MLHHRQPLPFDDTSSDRSDRAIYYGKEFQSLHQPAVQSKRKLRILALHGFGQRGEYLRIALRTRQLSEYLSESIHAGILSQYDEIEWLCPDGPVALVTDSRHDSLDSGDIEMWAWWRSLDFDLQHDRLYSSLAYLCDYVKTHGPAEGVVGFSQGAAMATIFAALCEGSPGRMSALMQQGSPLTMEPPQDPVKFAVLCCGFQASLQYYDGFYTPKISAPSLHIVADFDTMVSTARTAALADACKDARIIHFRGTHHVPTDPSTLRTMADFMSSICAKQGTPSLLPQIYVLPAQALDKQDAVFPGSYACSISSTASSTPSTRSTSSSFSCTSRRRLVWLIFRSSTMRRSYSSPSQVRKPRGLLPTPSERLGGVRALTSAGNLHSSL